MACTLYVAWDGRLAGYDFGTGHPMAPARVELTIELARAFGLFAEAGVSVESPVPATDAELELVHDPRYIAEVRLAGGDRPDAPMLSFFGLGAEDDPVFAGVHDASALVAGATRAAARAVWAGAAQHGASPPARPASRPAAVHRRAAHRARRDPPARPRARGRALAADRGRRLRARARGAA